jgi:hypothetical protein
MRLPFTHDQFLDVFAAFNTAWWPANVALWLLSALVLGTLAVRRADGRIVAALLALHWTWAGLVYHLGYFAAINPAAKLFGLLFVLQAALFVWFGVIRRPPTFSWGSAPRQWLSVAFCLYALAYPLLALASGLRWPRMPGFGVPCPTALLTVGLLLALRPRRLRGLGVMPLLWTVVGGSAAIVLQMTPDFALPLGGAVLLLYLLAPGVLRRRRVARPAPGGTP